MIRFALAYSAPLTWRSGFGRIIHGGWMRGIANAALRVGAFDRLYSLLGRDWVRPEGLRRALLFPAFYSIRSAQQLVEWITTL